MKSLKIKRQSGFTIIELIVAISIVVLLTGVAVNRFTVFTDQQEFQSEGQKIANCIQKAQSYAKDPSGMGLTQTPKYVEARLETYETGSGTGVYNTRCLVYFLRDGASGYSDINNVSVDDAASGNINEVADDTKYSDANGSMLTANTLVLYDSNKVSLSGSDMGVTGGLFCRSTGLIVTGLADKDGNPVGDGGGINNRNNNCGDYWKPGDLGLYEESAVRSDGLFEPSSTLAKSTLAHLNKHPRGNNVRAIRLIFSVTEGGVPIALKCSDGCNNQIVPMDSSPDSFPTKAIPFGNGFSTYIFIDNANNDLKNPTNREEFNDYKDSITGRGMIKIPALGYPIKYENVTD